MNITDVVEKIKECGYSVIPQAVDINKLERVKGDFDRMTGTQLKSDDQHFRVVYEPYLNCPSTLELAFDNQILEIARQYLGCPIGLGTCNLRRSKVTSNPPISTNLFHMDENCGKGINILKAFFYLNDVDLDGGPFEYIRGSHKNKIPGWQNNLRWRDEDIYGFYGQDHSVKFVADYGDLILADTTGFHRGMQVKTRPRTMFTANYVRRMEKDGQCLVSRATYEKYTHYQDMFSFAKVV